ncbi:hypothetical protein DSLASN_15900 [Desulfoluna limicola]|uniref:Uncharacterized protein n=1 Tax=Desulfoluna limicola TaxID=2810562 RepID=A0ABN6F1V5_9BACT|nr:hypothetical protein DSLASN_15900 [Desulfoluna limicola]
MPASTPGQTPPLLSKKAKGASGSGSAFFYANATNPADHCRHTLAFNDNIAPIDPLKVW